MTARARRRSTLGAAGVVVLAVALGACTGEPSVTDPVPVASASSPVASASPTPSPAATAPVWDAAMDQVTVDGALAVGRYFLELYPYVIETGDTAEWDRLSHPECLFCSDARDYATSAKREAPTLQVSAVTGQEVDPGALYSVTVEYTETTSAGESQASHALVAVVRQGDRWLVRGVQVDPAQ